MAQDVYVYSTLSCDQIYTNSQHTASGVPTAASKILIKGGANLMTKAMVTPRGVVTKITAEELQVLRANEVFKLHMANGFITISEAKADADVVAADMTGRDQSAPIVEQDGDIPLPASAEIEEAPRRGRPRKVN
ncbi:MAG TPA: hypothetical protein VKY62_01455 [Devosia sp.]|nr:hypothetical protein [Devosia sp.]